jgi:multicomponent Na+:H+ antiporter subunit D
MLLFTALAFWLLLPKLHAKAIVSVDTDWVYRKLPHLLRDADLQRHLPRRIPSPPAASADRLGPGLDHRPGPDRRGPGLDRRGPGLDHLGAGDGPSSSPRSVGTLARLVAPAPTPPPLIGTWVLGAVVLLAAVLLLVVSLQP